MTLPTTDLARSVLALPLIERRALAVVVGERCNAAARPEVRRVWGLLLTAVSMASKLEERRLLAEWHGHDATTAEATATSLAVRLEPTARPLGAIPVGMRVAIGAPFLTMEGPLADVGETLSRLVLYGYNSPQVVPASPAPPEPPGSPRSILPEPNQGPPAVAASEIPSTTTPGVTNG